MDLAEHFRTIISNWWRLLLVAAVVAAGVFVWSSTRDEVYEATALVSVADLEATGELNVTDETLTFRSDFYGRVAESRPVAAAAADKAGLDLTGGQAQKRYSVDPTDTAGILIIRAEGPTPEEARDLAQGVAEALGEQITKSQEAGRTAQEAVVQARIASLEEELADPATDPELADLLRSSIAVNQASLIDLRSQEFFRVTTIQGALASPDPVSPTPTRDALLAGLLAFVVAAEGTVLWRAYGDRFSRGADVQTITEETGLPVLARIPRGRGPEVVEAFRTLRTNLLFLEGTGHPRTLAVVSPNMGSGKSFCALNLAESAAAVDASVVLIDADLRRPVLHTRLRCDREPGLSDALRGVALSKCLHTAEGMPTLQLMPSGSPVSDTVGVLGGRALRQVLDALESAELVVVDTPPGSAYADALAVSAQCDAVLLVLDAKTTRRREARQMMEALERTGATIVGIALNGATVSRRDTYERY